MRTNADERSVADAIAEATAGWEPEGDREFNPREYAWTFLPCPDCGEARLTGVHDPDEQLAVDDTTFVVIPAGGEHE